MRRRATVVFALLLLAGCSTRRTIKAYPGPERPDAELATVTVARPGILADEKHALYIVAVDGVLVAQKSLLREQIVTVLVEPGRHSVSFGFHDGNSWSTAPATLVFDAVAGTTYELHAADSGSFGQQLLAALSTRGHWQAWITERPTGRVVAGTAPH